MWVSTIPSGNKAPWHNSPSVVLNSCFDVIMWFILTSLVISVHFCMVTWVISTRWKSTELQTQKLLTFRLKNLNPDDFQTAK